MRITIAVDESGAKNYSDKDEKVSGEFGVMVGIIVCDSLFDCSSYQKIVGMIDSEDRKKHITDLPVDLQTKLRKYVFDNIKFDRNIICIYNAVYVHGLNRRYNEDANDWDTRDKSNIPDNIKQKSPVRPICLHKILFDGLVIKALCHCEQLDKTEFSDSSYIINIVTDNVDKSILNLFRQSIDERIKITSLQTIKNTAYNLDEKRNIENSLVVEFTGDGIESIDRILNKIKMNVKIDNTNTLVIMADVIANSLSYHLKEKMQSNSHLKLNSPEAIAGYELADCFIFIDSNDFYDNVFNYEDGGH